MTVDYAHNVVADRARQRKAEALADGLRVAGHSIVEATGFEPAERRRAERQAGVRRASNETWLLALTLLGRA